MIWLRSTSSANAKVNQSLYGISVNVLILKRSNLLFRFSNLNVWITIIIEIKVNSIFISYSHFQINLYKEYSSHFQWWKTSIRLPNSRVQRQRVSMACFHRVIKYRVTQTKTTNYHIPRTMNQATYGFIRWLGKQRSCLLYTSDAADE